MTRSNRQKSLIVLQVPTNLGRRNQFIISPTELQYRVLKLILKVSARTPASSTLFRNLCCNVSGQPTSRRCLRCV